MRCTVLLHMPRLAKLVAMTREATDAPDLPTIGDDGADVYPCELEAEHPGRHQVAPPYSAPFYQSEWVLEGNSQWEGTESFKAGIREWQAGGRQMPRPTMM